MWPQQWFSDRDYQKTGGEIVYSHEEIFGRVHTIIKVEPPTEEEVEMMVEGQTLFSLLHLGMRTPKNIKQLMNKQVTTIGYELMKIEEHEHSVLDAMGGIAGAMLPQFAGRFLEIQHGGRGVLISAQPGIPSASIVILGAGHVGTCAIKAFLGLGAQVMVLDRDLTRLRRIDELTNKRAVTAPTTHSHPVFVEEGVIHYCVPNIPSAVPRTSSHALSNVVFPYFMEMAALGIDKTMESDTAFKKGVYMIEGEFTDKRIDAMFFLD